MHAGEHTGAGWARAATTAPVARAFGVVWDHLVLEDPPTPSDAIFCFGSRHWRVPRRAASLFSLGVAPVVLVSGGPADPGGPCEADVFAADLIAAGVPEDRIVVERRAANTGENVRFGMDALRRRGGARRVTAVSWPLAARRCRATFARVHPALEVVSAPALPAPGVRWTATQRRIRFALGELDRLERYAEEGHTVAQPRSAEVQHAGEILRAEVGRSGAVLRSAEVRASADGPSSVHLEAPWAQVDSEDAALLLPER